MSAAFAIAELATFGLLGAALGGVYAIVVLRLAPSPVRVFGGGLVIAAVVYPVFALLGGAGWTWLGIELVGVAVFGALALATLRGRGGTAAAAAVAVGWGLHPLWDVLLHASAVGAFADAPGAGHVPSWYPPACATFDWVVALAVGALAFQKRPLERYRTRGVLAALEEDRRR
jgi:hypothetical protein